MMRMPDKQVRLAVAAPLLIALCGIGGCGLNWQKLRGEGFTDSMSSWSANLRGGETSGSPLGTSEKALQIERNLGYR